MIEQDIKKVVLKCEVLKLLELIENKSNCNDLVSGILFDVGIKDHNITAYFCAAYIANNAVSDITKATFHHMASVILTCGLVFIEGAYDLGFYHEMKAIEYSQNNKKYILYLLTIYTGCPDFEMDCVIQEKMARTLLELDPNNDVALRLLKKGQEKMM